MNCDLAQELLQRNLDGTPMESPEWLAHLRDCAECRALASAGRRLQDGLQLLTSPQPPADLAVRIVEAVRLDCRRLQRRTRRRWVVALALAACLLIALTLRFESLKTSPGGTNAAGTGVSPVAGLDRRPAGPSETSPTLRESAADLGEVFAALSSQTADETMGKTRSLVPDVLNPSLSPVRLTAMESPSRPLREAGEGVSAGLEPVATSARRAVNLFLRELTPMEMGQKGL